MVANRYVTNHFWLPISQNRKFYLFCPNLVVNSLKKIVNGSKNCPIIWGLYCPQQWWVNWYISIPDLRSNFAWKGPKWKAPARSSINFGWDPENIETTWCFHRKLGVEAIEQWSGSLWQNSAAFGSMSDVIVSLEVPMPVVDFRATIWIHNWQSPRLPHNLYILHRIHKTADIQYLQLTKGAPARESCTGGRLVSPRISLEKKF